LHHCAADGQSNPVSQTCASSAQCDAPAQACDVCAAGQHQCSGTVLQVCNATLNGWTSVVDCSDAGACNAGSAQCVDAGVGAGGNDAGDAGAG
jgi:hypothetical protein